MSDPVSNAEVEDVLASIRRLVSEEKRPVAAENASSPAEAGKLVLTPSLRVMDAAPEPQGAPADIGEALSAEVFAGPEAASGDEDLPVVDQDAQAAENARLAAALVRGLNAGQTLPDTEMDEGGEEDDPASETLVGAAFNSPPLDEANPGVDQRAADAVSVDLTLDMGEPSAALVIAETDSDVIESAFAQSVPEPENPFAEEARQDPLSLSAKIAALEAAVGKRQDDWEPDGVAEAEPYSGTQAPALAWDDNTEAEASTVEDNAGTLPGTQGVQAEATVTTLRTEVPVPETALEAEGDAAADLLEDAALLDEDALRDMVAEIVREELQGALGERITRNVRKLVRREIQRALTAHDLD